MTTVALPVKYETRRPGRYDEPVVRAAVARLLPEVVAWCKAYGDKNPNEKEISEDLFDVCDSCTNDDGYDLAKDLEDHHLWDSDSELVDTLDNFSFYVMDACRAATRKWVTANSIAPPLPTGVRVRAKWGSNTVEGEISEIYADVAQYLIRREGDTARTGAIVDYENVLEVVEVPNAEAGA